MSYNIRIDSQNNILAAGFCDFSKELGAGDQQVIVEADVMPSDLDTHWQYDPLQGVPVLRQTPLAPPAERAYLAAQQRYAGLQTTDDRVALLAQQLGLA